MVNKTIYNCHNHIFTHDNIPNNFFPLKLVSAARVAPLRWALQGILKLAVPLSKNDQLHRYAAFIKAAYRSTQQKNLDNLISYYPEESKFIILPMDMALMEAGKVREEIDQQHEELARIARQSKYKDKVIPFAHIDPRREDSLDRLKKLVEKDGFQGVKIYPPLGYRPSHSRLMGEIYPYMVEKNIPLMAHCSPGSVNNKEMSIEKAHAMADPDNYHEVMSAFPELKVCLAHFGGISEWKRHICEARQRDNPTWLTKIVAMMESGKYPNLYADISYTIFNFQENTPLLKILLQNEKVLPRVLFGSDFYMVENEKYSEKRLSIDLRSALGETLFWQIANTNPLKYLAK